MVPIFQDVYLVRMLYVLNSEINGGNLDEEKRPHAESQLPDKRRVKTRIVVKNVTNNTVTVQFYEKQHEHLACEVNFGI